MAENDEGKKEREKGRYWERMYEAREKRQEAKKEIQWNPALRYPPVKQCPMFKKNPKKIFCNTLCISSRAS